MQNSQCHSPLPEKISPHTNPTLIFFGYRKPSFFSHRTAHASLPRSPPPISMVQGIKRHKCLVAQVLVAVANSIVSFHCTLLDLQPPQHRTASVLRSAYPCFFPPLQELGMPFYPCDVFAPLPILQKINWKTIN